ncbi:MAG: hypothetical protein WC437_03785 [Patescibacteria group bacterium]|jgi:hypothetical protein|nr:hypothetical protein [Patescibacteria group bacterium]
MTKIKTIYQNSTERFVKLFGRMFFHDVISLVMMTVSAIMLLMLFMMLLFRVSSGNVMVPLNYNSIYGVTSSVAWYKLYFLPLSYLFLSIVNIFISWAFFEKERLITYLVLFVNLIIGLTLIIMEFNLTSLVKG